MTRPTLPTCRAHYPDGPDRCACRLLPRLHGLPRNSGGSASATSLSRPAQASLTLRPVGFLHRPRRTLSRGFGPVGCPSKPLVSYQRNRHLAGWNLPPLANRAVGAHRIFRASISTCANPSPCALNCDQSLVCAVNSVAQPLRGRLDIKRSVRVVHHGEGNPGTATVLAVIGAARPSGRALPVSS